MEGQQRHKSAHMRPTTVIVLGFLIAILIGTVLLMLPMATRSRQATSFIDALFTATSATCVTGLVVADTATYWSNFGQMIILFLIQIGGLGFMSVATIGSMMLRRTITLRERLVMSAGLNLTDSAGIVRLTRRVLFGTLFFEGIGAVILSCCFVPRFGWAGGIKRGIFHSVSAFCNAGFDLMGRAGKPFLSMTEYAADPVVNITLMLLIVIGGLGFFVWSDLYDKKGERHPIHRLRLHTKLVLVTTAVLLLLGFGITLVFEWNNPETLGALPFWEKCQAALFQSVTLRTAGFNTINQGGMTGATQAFSCLLMFIGGSPGSTAGGIKTVTVAVLFLAALSALRGKVSVSAFGRMLSPRSIMNAVTMLMIGITLVMGGSAALALFDHVNFHEALFEATSAFGTVGLSVGITPILSVASQVILILLMYLGRVGVLTLGVAVLMRHREPPKMHYPEANVMVG